MEIYLSQSQIGIQINFYMKTNLLIFTLVLLLMSCASTLYSEYTLIKKHPQTISNLEIKILNDTTGIITSSEDQSLQQRFSFTKKGKHFLVITFIDDFNKLVSLDKEDTLVYFKKELYIINEKHKLVFEKKK